MGAIVTEREYNIHYYEVDYKKRVLITNIVNYFGDLATYQSEICGIGMDYMLEKRLAWVLYKWDINMKEYPSYGDKIIVKTYAYSFRKFYAYRKYEICNEKGELIGTADSLWFLINIDKRRPVRISEEFYEAYGLDKSKNDDIAMEDILKVEDVHKENNFTVRYSDIDTNKHVNNSKYISWAIEVVPLDIVKDYTLKRLKVVYEKETTYGHEVRSLVQIDKKENEILCRHKIIDEEGKELTLLETIWEK